MTDQAPPQDSIISFKTARNSVYTYDDMGHTTRVKTSGEELPKQDLTVFVDVGARDLGSIADAYVLKSSRTKIQVVEQQADGQNRIVTDVKDVSRPDYLFVGAFRSGKMIKSKPASLFPRVGAYVFDSRRFEEDGVIRTERHLGHKVKSIEYRHTKQRYIYRVTPDIRF